MQLDVLLDKTLITTERRVSALATTAAGARRGTGERAIWGGIAVHFGVQGERSVSNLHLYTPEPLTS